MSARYDAIYWKQIRADIVERFKNAPSLNERLNYSQGQLEKRIGRRKVGALIRRFKAASLADQTLLVTLYEQRDPYRWLAEDWASTRSARSTPSRDQ